MITISTVIRNLGVTNKYKGYGQVIDALDERYRLDDGYFKITKDIYPSVALRHHTNSWSVEQNIRTIVRFCWENNRTELNRIAGHKLSGMPTNAEFLDILFWYMKKMNG